VSDYTITELRKYVAERKGEIAFSLCVGNAHSMEEYRQAVGQYSELEAVERRMSDIMKDISDV